LQALAIRRSASRMRLTAASRCLVVVSVLVCSCSTPTASSFTADASTAQINTNTPAGVRAKQAMDMLNSEWPIGPAGVATFAASDKVNKVRDTMENLWWDRPFTLTSVEMRAGTALLHLINSYGARQDVELHTDDNRMVDLFEAHLVRPTIDTWRDVDAELSRSGARYSYQAAKVTNGRCERVAGTNTAEPLPLASIFKLYVLYAVADAVKAGAVSWNDLLTVTAEGKTVGSSGLENLPPGAKVTVRTAAEKMIANSDNMATDLLIARVGTRAVERALVDAGHHDPASMTPFPTMHELFSIGWGQPDRREQWKNGSPQVRAQLLQLTNSVPYQPDPDRTRTPASNYGAEWYGTAEDICRVHAALQTAAVGIAAPVRQIVSAIPGIDLDPRDWPFVGAKAGNLPGDLTFSWYAEDHTGQAWVVSFQLKWPVYHGPSTGAWILSIAKQVFAKLKNG
jgi:beta-lactamase class A